MARNRVSKSRFKGWALFPPLCVFKSHYNSFTDLRESNRSMIKFVKRTWKGPSSKKTLTNSQIKDSLKMRFQEPGSKSKLKSFPPLSSKPSHKQGLYQNPKYLKIHILRFSLSRLLPVLWILKIHEKNKGLLRKQNGGHILGAADTVFYPWNTFSWFSRLFFPFWHKSFFSKREWGLGSPVI